MTGSFERHLLPNSAELFYRDSDHSYFRAVNGNKGSGRLTAVSTVIKAFETSSDGLLEWAAKLQCEGVAALAQDGLDWEEPDSIRSALGWLQTGESVWDALVAADLTWRQIRDQAAKRGTNIHRHALQALAEGKPVPDYSKMTAEEKGYTSGIVHWWHDWGPTPYQTEAVVADLELGVAGRFDLMAVGEDLCLFDAKTKKLVPRKMRRPFYPIKDQVQVAGYDFLAGRSGYQRSVSQFILYVDADGDYELVESKAHHEDFRLAVAVHTAAREIRTARMKPREEQLRLA